MYITTKQIKKKFIDFFCKKEHENKTNNEIIQKNDPTLLFINAGMVPYKKFFLDDVTTYKNIVSIQRCIRQNDLSSVGKTKFHHTFFEMLGNFSFGNYFKDTAIQNAWEFLTKILKIDNKNLYVTVHTEDIITYDIWKNIIGLQKNQIIKKRTNFWSAGSLGPCGPCSEIFYTEHDTTKTNSNSMQKNSVELWNLVFIQYNKTKEKQLEILKKKSIDTGMGVERVAFVLQKKKNTYETDIFKNTLAVLQKLIHKNNYNEELCYKIVDHLRCCIILFDKDITPGSVGKNYILRKLLQKTFIYIQQLQLEETHLNKLITAALNDLKETNIEINKSKNLITEMFKTEYKTTQIKYKKNSVVLNKILTSKEKITGELLFKLYETYGLSVEQYSSIINDNHAIEEFKQIFKKNQEKNRLITQEKNIHYITNKNIETKYVGYEKNSVHTKITHIIQNQKNTNVLEKGQQAYIILEETPFYPESGGQIGDIGSIKTKKAEFTVEDTKILNNLHIHIGYVKKGSITVDSICIAKINKKHRNLLSVNHTVTHILNTVLKQTLGEQVKQKGSLITDKKLRFDFTYDKKIKKEKLLEIENNVNNILETNDKVNVTIEQNKHRIVRIGKKTSVESCCGTHVKNLKEIFFFKIVTERGIGENTRRIEALTNINAIKYIYADVHLLDDIAQKLCTTKNNILNVVEKKIKKINTEIKQNNNEDSTLYVIKNTKIMLIECVLKKEDRGILVLDKYKNIIDIDIMIIICVKQHKIELLVQKKTKTNIICAADLVKRITRMYNGSGGGTNTLGRGGFIRKENDTLNLKKNFYTTIKDML